MCGVMKRRQILILGIFVLGLLIVMGIGISQALVNSGLSKEYNETTKTAIIRDSSNAIISEIQLRTPQVVKVIRGKDRKVAELTFKNIHPDFVSTFPSQLNDMDFFDLNSNRTLNRDFTYKFKNSSLVSVPFYREICSDVDLYKNGTISSVCVREQDGFVDKEVIEWIPFLSLSEVPFGEFTLGIFTDVKIGDKVEWVPTFYGVKIDEWAAWEESFNVGLRAYYEFEETSGPVLDSLGDLDGTNFGATRGVDGIIGNSFYYDGGNDNVSLTSNWTNLTAVVNMTYNVWINATNLPSTTNPILRQVSNPCCSQIYLNIRNVAPLRFRTELILEDEATQQVGAITTIGLHEWYMLTITRSGSNVTAYVNGVIEHSVTMTSTSQNSGTGLLRLGLPAGAGTRWNGSIDELGIWNRTLSPADVSHIYNSGSGIAFVPPDITPPETTMPIITPSTLTTTDDLVCSATLTDSVQTDLTANWTWYRNNVSNLSGITINITNGTNTNIITLDSGNTTKGENWICEITPYDSFQYGNATNSTEINIGNALPDIPIQLSPSNSSNFTMDSIITFVWSNSSDIDTDNPIITYDLEIYNESDMAAANLIHSNTSITEGSGNTSINIRLSDYTTVDDDYYWRVRANDSEDYSNWSDVRTFQYANWTITFNLTDSGTGVQIDTSQGNSNFDISCNNGFSTTDVNNPYTAIDFGVGTVQCTFSDLTVGPIAYFDRTQNITVNNDTTVGVSMSRLGGLSNEEHTWLEFLYNCWNGGDCYNLLNNINTTTTQTWQRLTGTDISVITQENVISYVLNTTSNITINYTINIPYKSEVAVNELLPIRLYFWFTDAARTTCFNQDKTTDTNRAEGPYCLPLVAEILGPNNGSVTFTVDLRPNISSGTYNFTRSIEIDPLGVWTQYGREDIGQIEVLVSGGDADIEISNEDRINAKQGAGSSDSSEESSGSTSAEKETTTNNQVQLSEKEEKGGDGEEEGDVKSGKPGITGAVIGAGQQLLSGWQFVAVIAILGIIFIVFIVVSSRTILRFKGRK